MEMSNVRRRKSVDPLTPSTRPKSAIIVDVNVNTPAIDFVENPLHAQGLVNAPSRQLKHTKRHAGACFYCKKYYNHEKPTVRYGCRAFIVFLACYFIACMALAIQMFEAVAVDCTKDFTKCLIMRKAEVSNLCSNEMQLNLDADMIYNAWAGLNFYSMNLQVSHNGNVLATSSASPTFLQSDGSYGPKLTTGVRPMSVTASIQMGEVVNVANLLDSMQSTGTAEIVMTLSSAKVWMWSFLVPFPITTPSFIGINMLLTCSRFGRSWGCAGGRNPIMSNNSLSIGFNVDSIGVDVLNPGTSSEGLTTQANLTINMGDVPFVMHMPSFSADVYISGIDSDPTLPTAPFIGAEPITTLTTSPALMHGLPNGGQFNISANAVVTGGASKMKAMSDLINRIVNRQPSYMYIVGAGGNSSTCYLQTIADTMKPFKIEMPVALPPVQSNQSSIPITDILSLKSFSFNDFNNYLASFNFTAGLDVPFIVYGTLPSVSLNIMAPSSTTNQPVVVAQVMTSSFTMEAGNPLMPLSVQVNILNDLLLFQRLASSKSLVDLAALNLTFSGTPGYNLASSAMAGVSINTASLVSSSDLNVVQKVGLTVSANITSDTSSISGSISANVTSFPMGFTISSGGMNLKMYSMPPAGSSSPPSWVGTVLLTPINISKNVSFVSQTITATLQMSQSYGQNLTVMRDSLTRFLAGDIVFYVNGSITDTNSRVVFINGQLIADLINAFGLFNPNAPQVQINALTGGGAGGGVVLGVGFQIQEVRVPSLMVQKVKIDLSCDTKNIGSPCLQNNATGGLLGVAPEVDMTINLPPQLVTVSATTPPITVDIFASFDNVNYTKIVAVSMQPLSLSLGGAQGPTTFKPVISLYSSVAVLQFFQDLANNALNNNIENIYINLVGNLDSTLLSAFIPKFSFAVPLASLKSQLTGTSLQGIIGVHTSATSMGANLTAVLNPYPFPFPVYFGLIQGSAYIVPSIVNSQGCGISNSNRSPCSSITVTVNQLSLCPTCANTLFGNIVVTANDNGVQLGNSITSFLSGVANNIDIQGTYTYTPPNSLAVPIPQTLTALITLNSYLPGAAAPLSSKFVLNDVSFMGAQGLNGKPLDLSCLPGWQAGVNCLPLYSIISLKYSSSWMNIIPAGLVIQLTIPNVFVDVSAVVSPATTKTKILSIEASQFVLDFAKGGLFMQITYGLLNTGAMYNLFQNWQNNNQAINLFMSGEAPSTPNLLSGFLYNIVYGYTIPAPVVGASKFYELTTRVTENAATGGLDASINYIFSQVPLDVVAFFLPALNVEASTNSTTIGVFTLQPTTFFAGMTSSSVAASISIIDGYVIPLIRQSLQNYLGGQKLSLSLLGSVGGIANSINLVLILPDLNQLSSILPAQNRNVVQFIINLMGLNTAVLNSLNVQGGSIPVMCMAENTCTQAVLDNLPIANGDLSLNATIDLSTFPIFLNVQTPELHVKASFQIGSGTIYEIATLDVPSITLNTLLGFIYLPHLGLVIPPKGLGSIYNSIIPAFSGQDVFIYVEGVPNSSPLSSLIPQVKLNFTNMVTTLLNNTAGLSNALSLATITVIGNEHQNGADQAITMNVNADISGVKQFKNAVISGPGMNIALLRLNPNGPAYSTPSMGTMNIKPILVGSNSNNGVLLTATASNAVMLRSFLSDFAGGTDVFASIVTGAGALNINTQLYMRGFNFNADILNNDLTRNVIVSSCNGQLCLFGGIVVVDSVNLLGGSLSGAPLNIPCIFDFGNICSSDTTIVYPSTQIAASITLHFKLPIPSRIILQFPPINMNLGCCVNDLLLNITIPAINYDSSLVSLTVNPTMTVVNWQKVRKMVDNLSSLNTTFYAYSADLSPGSISSIIPRFPYTLAASQGASLMNFQVLIPLPFYSSNTWSLVSSTAMSATFNIIFNFKNPAPIGLLFKNFNLQVNYGGQTIAKLTASTADLSITTGQNNLVFVLTVLGDSNLSTCTYASSSTRCALAQVANLYLSQLQFSIGMSVGYTNSLGFNTNINLNFLMYETATSPLILTVPSRNKALVIIDTQSLVAQMVSFTLDLGTTIGDTISNAVTHLTLSTPVVALTLALKNPLALPLSAIAGVETTMNLDLNFEDYDGAYCIFTNSFPAYICSLLGFGTDSAQYSTYPITASGAQGSPIVGTGIGGSKESVDMTKVTPPFPLLPNGAATLTVNGATSLDAVERLIDEAYLQGRLCMDARNAVAGITLKATNSNVGFAFTTNFDVSNMIFYRKQACATAKPPACTAPTVTNVLTYSASSFNFMGNAFNSNNNIQLSSTGNSLSGAAYFNTALKVIDDWEADFTFTLTPHGGSTGGFAFVLQGNNPVSTPFSKNDCQRTFSFNFASVPLVDLNTYMSCAGFYNIPNSVAVVFSTKTNSMVSVLGVGDTGGRGVIYVVQGGTETSAPSSTDTNILAFHQIPTSIWNPASTSTNNVRIVYDGLSFLLHVYLNDMTTPIVSASLNLQDSTIYNWIGGSNGNVGVLGYSSGSYGLSFSTLKFGVASTVVTKSFVEEKGTKTSLVGQAGYFFIDARNSCGYPRHLGGDVWQLLILSGTNAATIQQIIDIGTGRYQVIYTASVPGTYTVYASLSGAAQTSSPSLGTIIVVVDQTIV